MNSPFEVLGLDDGVSAETVKMRWRELRSSAHPDKGGDAEVFHRLNLAYDAAMLAAQSPISCDLCAGSGKQVVHRGVFTTTVVCGGCAGSGTLERV